MGSAASGGYRNCYLADEHTLVSVVFEVKGKVGPVLK
jgi:hypothetical protein